MRKWTHWTAMPKVNLYNYTDSHKIQYNVANVGNERHALVMSSGMFRRDISRRFIIIITTKLCFLN